MLHTMWSVKGGSGVSVTAALAATMFARERRRVLVVDLRGDQPAVLGVEEPSGPGVRDWLASTDGSESALDRLLIDLGHGVWLLPSGAAQDWPSERPRQLVAALRRMRCEVVVDAGVLHGPGLGVTPIVTLGRVLAGAGRSWLVVRPCYLTVRRAVAERVVADGLILVQDPGRSLGAREVSRALRTPVVATVSDDPAIARSVDSGQVLRRSPRGLDKSLRGVA